MKKWILIIASVCYPTTTDLNVTTALTFNPAPPRPSIEVREFPLRETLDAFVLQRIVWGQCSETLVVVTPEGKVFRVAKTERLKKVVREVEEHDGFGTTWTPTPETGDER